MYDKILFVVKNKLIALSTEKLIYKVLDKNMLISNLAKCELLKRDLSNLTIDDNILEKIINKLSVEDIWNLVKLNANSHFTELVSKKLNQIFDYYQELNKPDFLMKKNESDLKIYVLKK